MTVLTFQPRFVPLVEGRTKIHTIRAFRRRPIRVGDTLSLRTWTGRPYNSPQRILFDTVCIRTQTLVVGFREIAIIYEGAADHEALARSDGFATYADMADWFHKTHGLPFTGVLIAWEPHP